MPAADRRFKQTVPVKQAPAFLRSLADALEGRTENPPPLMGVLSERLSRLEIKAKTGAGIWKFKVKIRTTADGACEEKNWEALQSSYTALARLKRGCHKTYR